MPDALPVATLPINPGSGYRLYTMVVWLKHERHNTKLLNKTIYENRLKNRKKWRTRSTILFTVTRSRHANPVSCICNHVSNHICYRKTFTATIIKLSESVSNGSDIMPVTSPGGSTLQCTRIAVHVVTCFVFIFFWASKGWTKFSLNTKWQQCIHCDWHWLHHLERKLPSWTLVAATSESNKTIQEKISLQVRLVPSFLYINRIQIRLLLIICHETYWLKESRQLH